MALLWQAAAVSAWQAAVRPCARPRTVRAGPRASASSEASSFGTALAQAWQQDPTALRELLGRDVVVDTPIWSCTDAADYLEKLGEAAVFFGGSDDEFGRAGETAPAQLNVLSEQQLPSGETIERGMTFEDFCKHPISKAAKLEPPHVLALRAYCEEP